MFSDRLLDRLSMQKGSRSGYRLTLLLAFSGLRFAWHLFHVFRAFFQGYERFPLPVYGLGWFLLLTVGSLDLRTCFFY